MSSHLAKAKAALSDAALLKVSVYDPADLPRSYLRLLDLATVQAHVATAATRRDAALSPKYA